MKLLRISPSGPQCQMLQGLLLPMPNPQVWEPDMGLRTLTPVHKSLQYSYFPVCVHLVVMGLLLSHKCPSCHLDVASSLSSGAEYPFFFLIVWETHTHTHWERHTLRYTHTPRDIHTYLERHIQNIQRHTHTERDIHWDTHTHLETYTHT